VTTPRTDRSRQPTQAEIQEQIEGLFRLDDEGAGELLLVRHAQPATRFDGDPPADPMLSCEGLEQAERLAERLECLWVDTIYTAPERRAFQTARVIAGLLQRPLNVLDDLAEIDFDPDRFEPAGESYLQRFSRTPRWDSLPGYAPAQVFRRRAIHAIEMLQTDHPARRIVVVTHASLINACIGALLCIPRDQFFAPNHASVSSLRYLDGLQSLRSLNDTSHLSIADRIGGFAAALTARSLPLTNR
jgi:broad specificity phosphatase PhoE